jgi:ADP-heptose:LPS heptosyltransferase
VPPAWRERARAALAAAGADPGRAPMLVHPGAGGARKRWAPAGFAAALARLGARAGVEVVVHQGPADAEAVRDLLAVLGPGLPRLVEPDLATLAAVLAAAAGYLGGDSGVSQLAAAVGAPGVIVYPADTRERWAPWSAAALAVSARDDPGLAAEVAARLAERLRPADGTVSGRPPGTTAASRPSSRASP